MVYDISPDAMEYYWDIVDSYFDFGTNKPKMDAAKIMEVGKKYQSGELQLHDASLALIALGATYGEAIKVLELYAPKKEEGKK